MCIVNNCNNKDKYGEYCYKHRREYLVDKDTNRIILERWTNKCSDYFHSTNLIRISFYSLFSNYIFVFFYQVYNFLLQDSPIQSP